MADQLTFPSPPDSATSPDFGAQARDYTPEPPPKKTRKKAAKKKAAKKAGKKAAKKTAKKAGKKAAKKAGKKTAKKAGKKKASKRATSAKSVHGCSAVLQVTPTNEVAQLAAWSELSRFQRRRFLMLMGAAAAVSGGIAFFLYRRTAKAALPQGAGSAGGDTIEIMEDVPIDVDVKTGGTALPDPIKLGNIPPLYTRI